MMMALMTRRHSSVTSIREFKIKNVLPKGISFHEDIVCVKEDSDIMFFHSRCTHLGCRINKAENNKLICPCHGSEFDVKGNTLKGPANKALQKLDYSFDKANDEFVIKLV